MDAIQERHEHAVACEFIRYRNSVHGDCLEYRGRPEGAGDALCVRGDREIIIEETNAFHDVGHAKFEWQNARNLPGAPKSGFGINFDMKLIRSINARLAEKCVIDYGAGSILLINVPSRLTDAARIESLLCEVDLPASVPFAQIFVVGQFPWGSSSVGGYRCWQIHPRMR